MDILDHFTTAAGLDKCASDIAEDQSLNVKIASIIADAPEGVEGLTKVAAAGSLFIKRKQRERSVVRRLNDFVPTSDSDLVRVPDEDQPILWGEIQSDTAPALSINFDDAVENETFWRRTFKVRFFVVASREYYKNEWELKAHAHDTIKQITEDTLIDVDDEEDRHWFTGSDECVGPRADSSAALDNTFGGSPAVGLSGSIQNFWLGAWSRERAVDSKYLFKDRQLPLSKIVANHRYMANFEKLTDAEIGSRAGDMFMNRADAALAEMDPLGIPHLFTQKSWLVPDDTIYLYTDKEHLGFCREYKAPTMSMRKEKRTVYFSVEEIIAMAIVNTAGVLKGLFRNHTDAS